MLFINRARLGIIKTPIQLAKNHLVDGDKALEIGDYLASMAGLFFIYIIIWYIILNQWLPTALLSPIGSVLGLAAIILTAIFVVDALRSSE